MIAQELRTAIATAVSAIDGLTGYPKRPTSISDGDVWPQWGGAARGDDRLFVNTVRVVLALPGDEDKADEWIDLYGEQLFEALSPLLYITAFEPAVLPMTGTDSLALQITGITE